jgi:predicted transcriptional regulator
MKTNALSDFSDLLESNAQSLGNTGSSKPPTGEALGLNPVTGSSAAQPTPEALGLVPAINTPGLTPAGSIVVQESMPSPLWNRKEPQYQRQQELPWHRTALEMAANGYTAEEVAARLGCSPTTVQDILRQPQYQQTQVNLIRQVSNQDHEVCELIKDNVKNAITTLATIVKDEKARGSDRIAAARELLDRRYGKPNQPMNRGTDVDLNNLSDAELARMLPPKTATGTNS